MQERLNKFMEKHQKRQATFPSVKFSGDNERLQHIDAIEQLPVGAQIKRVIDLLLEVIYLFLFLPFPFMCCDL